MICRLQVLQIHSSLYFLQVQAAEFSGRSGERAFWQRDRFPSDLTNILNNCSLDSLYILWAYRNTGRDRKICAKKFSPGKFMGAEFGTQMRVSDRLECQTDVKLPEMAAKPIYWCRGSTKGDRRDRNVDFWPKFRRFSSDTRRQLLVLDSTATKYLKARRRRPAK